MESLKLCLIFIVVPLTDGAVPGSFFWKPRLGIDLTIPTAGDSHPQVPLTKQNIVDGLVVMIDGYDAGMTVMALAVSVVEVIPQPHMNPLRGYFYTNAYRWILRHLSKLPYWLGGKSGNYWQTHKVWRKRFYYTESIIPKWLRAAMPHITEEDWRNEIKEQRRFKKFSESAFAKQYKFPSKTFNEFKSFETEDSDKPESSSSFHSSESYKG